MEVAALLLPNRDGPGPHCTAEAAIFGAGSCSSNTTSHDKASGTAFFGEKDHVFAASELYGKGERQETRGDTGTSLPAVLAFRSKHYLRQYPRGSDEREPVPGGVNEFVESAHLIVAVAEIIKIQITSGYDCILKIVEDKLSRRIKICVENCDEHLMWRNLVGG
jgi:hypothetical protein